MLCVPVIVFLRLLNFGNVSLRPNPNAIDSVRKRAAKRGDGILNRHRNRRKSLAVNERHAQGS
jgi:hypothetical protein